MSRPPGSHVLAALALAALTLPSVAGAQAPASTTDTSRGLRIQYADGRTVTSPLRQSGGMWTPRFPTIPGAETARHGASLSTLDVRHAIDGADVVLTVSLSYGGPGRHLTKVATVRVSAGDPVPIDELRGYGVEPILVSIVPISAAAAYAPAAVSVSSQVFVRAEAVGPNVSAYRIVVANDSDQPLMWFQFKAFRGERLALVGRPRGTRNLPLVQPGEQHAFEIATSTGGPASSDGPDAWRPIDRIEVTTVMWQDGVVEGDAGQASEQRRADHWRADHLRRVVQSLGGSPPPSIERIRQRIHELAPPDAETRQLRDSTLASLDGFLAAGATPDAHAFRAWVNRTYAEYAQWLGRLAPGGEPR
jgi:hypothetical protein